MPYTCFDPDNNHYVHGFIPRYGSLPIITLSSFPLNVYHVVYNEDDILLGKMPFLCSGCTSMIKRRKEQCNSCYRQLHINLFHRFNQRCEISGRCDNCRLYNCRDCMYFKDEHPFTYYCRKCLLEGGEMFCTVCYRIRYDDDGERFMYPLGSYGCDHKRIEHECKFIYKHSIK